MKMEVPTWLQSHWRQLSQENFSYLPHALIFLGPTGMGKRHLAHVLAMTLLCNQVKERSNGEGLFADNITTSTYLPCNQCQTCGWIKAGTHPDFSLLDLESNSSMGIGLIRALMLKLQATAHQGGWKIAVIDKAANMSIAAMNSLLKTLEEPTPNTLIILLVDSLSKLPATIRSRCQVLDFKADESHLKLLVQEMAGTDSKQVETAYQLAMGAPILSRMFLELGVVEMYLKWLAEWKKFSSGQVASFTLWQNLANYKIDGSAWCDNYEYYQLPIVFENPLLTWINNYLKEYLLSDDCLNQIEHYRDWFDLYQQIERRLYSMNTSVNRQLLMSDLITQWDHLLTQRPMS